MNTLFANQAPWATGKRWLAAAAAVLAVGLLSAGAAQAQVAQVGMNTPTTITGRITPGMTQLNLPFDLSGASRMSLDVIVPVDGASLILRAPDGSAAATSGTPGVNFYPGAALPMPTPGGVFDIAPMISPPNGRWVLELRFPAPSYSTVVIATLRAVSPIQAGIAIERSTVLVGEDVSIGMLLTNDGQPILGLRPTISVNRVGTLPGPALPAVDNGTGPDGAANDGLYSIDQTFTQPGLYDIMGQAVVPTPTGPVQRTAGQRITVVEPTLTNASVTLSNVTGAGGCVSGLRVALAFTASVDGSYAGLVQLAGSNGKVIESRLAFDAVGGTASSTVLFSAKDIKDKIGVDGPYTVRLIEVLDVSGDEFLLAFRRFSSGNFNIPLAGLCALPIELPGPLSVAAVLKSGFIGALDINIRVKVTVSGFYQISYKVFGAGGEDLGLINASRQLVAGVNNVTSRLDAVTLGQSDGPYKVSSLLVVSGANSLRQSVVGSSAAYSHWQYYPKITGDLNGDGSVDAADSALLINFRSQSALVPGDRRDVNKDGVINLLDGRALQRLACKAPNCPVNP